MPRVAISKQRDIGLPSYLQLVTANMFRSSRLETFFHTRPLYMNSRFYPRNFSNRELQARLMNKRKEIFFYAMSLIKRRNVN